MVSLLMSFSAPCTLVVDGHGNTGDETMTVALESDPSLRTLPAYGYRPDGSAWNWGGHTSPLFALVYGPAVRLAPTEWRIEAARFVSRVLGGLAVWLIHLALLQLLWRRPTREIPQFTRLAVLIAVAVVLLNSSSFKFIASFARIDMLGLFLLSAICATASWLLLAPSAIRLFAFTALATSTVLAGGVTLAMAALLVLATLTMLVLDVSLSDARVASPGGLVVAALAGCAVFILPARFLETGAFAAPGLSGLATVRAAFRWMPDSPLQIAKLARPERWLIVGGGATGLLICAIVASIPSVRVRARAPRQVWFRLGVIAVALLILALVFRFALLALLPPAVRLTYEILTITTFGFVALIVCCGLAGDWSAARMILGASICASLLLVAVRPLAGPSLTTCAEDASLRARRFWPASRALDGVFNPFALDEPNAARHRHVDAVRGYLLQHGVKRAFVTDPMLAVMGDDRVALLLLNDSGSPMESPAAEERLWDRWATPQGIDHIVSTPFGDSADLDRAGFSGLRACLRAAHVGVPGPCEVGHFRLRLTPVFSSEDVLNAAQPYQYADSPSTPIVVYRMVVSR